MSSILDVAALRAQEYPWMATDPAIYLNAASVGPLPQRTVEVTAEWATMRSRPHQLPFPLMQEAAATARAQFAALVGADADEIALMPNTTYGLNLAARALPLRPGVILTFDGEFPSCVYPFQALGSGITLDLIPKRDGIPDEDALLEAIGNRLMWSPWWFHGCSSRTASWPTSHGSATPVAHVASFHCRRHPGLRVRPIDLHALPVDIFASGAQKWQLSPWGTGFVYVRRELVTALEPHDVGWACMKASVDYTRLTDYEFDFSTTPVASKW